jgi:hypothetical protein
MKALLLGLSLSLENFYSPVNPARKALPLLPMLHKLIAGQFSLRLVRLLLKRFAMDVRTQRPLAEAAARLAALFALVFGAMTQASGAALVYAEVPAANNPFNGFNFEWLRMTFGDFDHDGDQDLLIGAVDGSFRYFKNTGSSKRPVFVEQTGNNDPFASTKIGTLSAPAFIDLDADGDLDVMIGHEPILQTSGETGFFNVISYLVNNAGHFTLAAGTANPFDGVIIGVEATPAPVFVDLDNDGKLDLVVGLHDGTIRYFKNSGSANNLSFTPLTGSSNPFNAIRMGAFAVPAFADVDGDGDLDAVIGSAEAVRFFRNTGTKSSPKFQEVTGVANPVNGIDFGLGTDPVFVDIDGDGDMDIVVGNKSDEVIKLYRALSSPSTPDLDASSDTGVSNSDNITHVSTPYFTGTAESGNTITLLDGSASIGSGSVGANGSWGITSSTLSNGVHVISATSTDSAGHISPSSGTLTVTIDLNAPAAPSAPDLLDSDDTGISSTDNITYRNQDAFTGTAVVGATVRLFDARTILLGSAVADSLGVWSIYADSLTDGVHNITATAEFSALYPSSHSSALSITIETAPLAQPSTPQMATGNVVRIDGDEYLTSLTTPTFKGTAAGANFVDLFVNSDYSGFRKTGTASVTNGSWSIASVPLENGFHSLLVQARDVAGNASPFSDYLFFDVENSVRSAFDLDGSTGSGSVNGLHAPANTLTLEAWVKYTGASFTGYTTILEFGNDGPWFGVNGDAGARAEVYGAAYSLSRGVPIGAWTHLAYSWDGTLGRIFMNGTVMGTFSSPPNRSGSGLGIGFGSGDHHWQGQIDEVRVWNVARTQSEIQQNMHRLLSGGESGLVAYYHADEGAGTSAADASEHGNGATLSAGAGWIFSTAPDAPALNAISLDTGVSGTDQITTDRTLVLSGTANPGSAISVNRSGVGTIGSTTAGSDGIWNFSYTGTSLSDGAYSFSATAVDTAGNSSGESSALTVNVDNVGPAVRNVSSSELSGRYNTGDLINIQINFNEAVLVTGIPQLLLETGNVDRLALYSAGSGGSSLTFVYEVQAGDTSAHLDYSSSSALFLNGGTISDFAGNSAAVSLPASGTPNSLGGARSIVIDTAAPAITDVTSSTPNGIYKQGNSISIRISFNEAVAVTGTPVLTLQTGATARTASYASGSGTSALSFTYLVQAGDSSADLDYISKSALTISSAAIQDLAGNDALLTLPSPGAGGSLGANKAIVIDAIVPSISGVTSSTANGSYKLGDTITIQVNLSESVTVTGKPWLTLQTGSVNRNVNYSSGSGSSTLSFTYVVQAGDSSADLDYPSSSSLALNGGTINDPAGNPTSLILPIPGGVNSLGANKNIQIDGVAPTVLNVTSSTSNGSYKEGDAISIQISFSEVVNVTGTPRLTLETGTTDRTANYTSGSGSSVLSFVYTVQAGDASAGLDYVVSSPLALNTGTIQDAVGNAASLVLPAAGSAHSLGFNKTIVIDTTAPTVSQVTATTSSGSYKEGAVISIQISFSEQVIITGTPQLTLETGTADRVANYTSGTGGTTITFNYTVLSGDSSADLDYVSASSLSLNGGTIKDAVGHSASLILPSPGAVNSLGASRNIVIDTTPPAVLSVNSPTANGSYRLGAAISIQISFSEIVKVSGTPRLTLETGTTDRTANYASGSGSTNLIFTYQVVSGDVSADLDYVSTSALTLNSGTILDLAGNPAVLTLPAPGAVNSLGANNNLSIDTSAPTISGVTSSTPDGSYKQGSAISIQLSFNEVVTVTGTPRLTLETGSVNRIVNYASGSGSSTLTFIYSVQAGDTSAHLDYVSSTTLGSGTIKDAAGNLASLILPAPGSLNSLGANKNIVIDTTAPTPVLSAPSATFSNGGTVAFIVAYAPGDIISLNSANIVLNATGNATGVLAVAGTGNARTVSISSISGTGTLGISLPAGTASDLAGNSALSAGPSVTFDVHPNLAPSFVIGANQIVSTNAGPQTVPGWAASLSPGLGENSQIIDFIVASDHPELFSAQPAVSAAGTLTYTPAPDIAGVAIVNVRAHDNGGTAGGGSDTSVPQSFSIRILGQAAVSNVTSSVPDGTYAAGALISIQVNFNTVVVVSGAPALTLQTGSIDRTAAYEAGSGSSVLTFTYSVYSGDYTAGLDYRSRTDLALNGGSINDALGNAASLELPGPGTSGSLSANKDIVIDALAPAPPQFTGISSDTGSSASDQITSDSMLLLHGVAESNSTVTITRTDAGVIGATVADSNGAWSFDYSGTSLPEGTHSFTATAADSAGNVSPPSGSFVVIVDTTSPSSPSVPDLISADDSGNSETDNITTVASPVFTGTAEPGSMVSLYDGLVQVGSTIAIGGTWSIASSSLDNGTHSMKARATDAAGNVSSFSQPLSVTIDHSAGYAIFLNGHGASVQINDLAVPQGPFTLEARVRYTAKSFSHFNSILEFGDHSLWLGVNGQENGRLELWTAGANSPIIQSDAAVLALNQWTHVACSWDGATGKLFINGKEEGSSAFPPVNGGDGLGIGSSSVDSPWSGMIDDVRVWNFARSSAEISQFINGGLTGTESGLLAYYPFDEGTGLNAADGSGHGHVAVLLQNAAWTSAAGPFPAAIEAMTPDTGISPFDGNTSATRITLQGYGEVGSTVTVSRAGSGVIGTVVPSGDGGWSFDYSGTALSDGVYSFTTTAADEAGNVSATSIFTVNIDTIAPLAPAFIGISPDTGSSSSDAITSQARPALRGTAEPNSSLRLYVSEFPGFAAFLPVSNDGTWSFDCPFGEGAYTFFATTEDSAGNISPQSSSFSLIVDTTRFAPVISEPAFPVPGGAAYTVTYGAGETVTLGAGDVTLNSTGSAAATIDVSGSGNSRTVALSNISGAGTLGISLAMNTSFDLAGNGAETAGPSATFTVGNTAPILDLNGAAPGKDAAATFYEQTPELIFPAAILTDAENSLILSLEVTLTSRPDGDSAEWLSLNAAGASAASGLTVTPYAPATGVLFIAGSAPPATYQTILQGILYNNNSENPSGSPRSVTVVLSDDAMAIPRTSLIAVQEINDPPLALNEFLSSVAEDSPPRVISFASLLSNDTQPSAESGQTLTITAVGNAVGGQVLINGSNVEFTLDADFNGDASFDYTVQDNGTSLGVSNPQTDVATAGFTVTPVADAPLISSATTSEGTQTASGLVISRNSADRTEVTHFRISSISNGALYQNDGVTIINNGDVITAGQGSAGLKFTPAPNLNSSSSIFGFVAQGATSSGGAGLGSGATAGITVGAVADTPAVTDATTPEDIQTTAGLVITKNATDGSEVTHFKITGITGGTLYQNDGKTPIINGDFITVAEGAAGLKFTPAANLNSQESLFGFAIRSSLSASDSGVGGGTILARITVNPVNDDPIAVTDVILRGGTGNAKVKISALLANDTDVDGDTISLVRVLSPSTGGATVSTSGEWVYFVSNGNLPDTFNYIIADGHGGTAIGTVQVNVQESENGASTAVNIAVDATGAHLVFDGLPGVVYTIEFKDNLADSWQRLGTASAGSRGVFHYDDPFASSGRFYRYIYR